MNHEPHTLHHTMRWYGPHDAVSLADIRQAGCAGVVTALHQVPVGEVWSAAAINERKALIEAQGMSWTVVESLPVHEEIKKAGSRRDVLISQYKTSLENLAAAGIRVITYNFMPVLDWLRTDIGYELDSGAKALYFNRSEFVAFDVFLLKRPGAANDYTEQEVASAKQRLQEMTEAQRDRLFRNLLLGLPGSDDAFTPAMVLEQIDGYHDINADTLRENLYYFLRHILPVAERLDLRMAIHPDDPPYPVLGLPRIMSTATDAIALIDKLPSASNGFCFCTGSFGARPDNDIIPMIRRLGDHIHFLHLRNTKRDEFGNFYEANHLDGDTDMYEVMKEIVLLQQRRQISLPMRPDHGHQMLDDLQKKTYPGYSAIGRLKGLAELRGLELGIRRSL